MFTPTNPETWPVLLDLEQVAEIYKLSPDSIRHSLTPKSKRVPFSPAPYAKYPLRWRRADVERDLIGARGKSPRKSRVA